ncbi:MAG TPA: DNA-directed RNA polymerase subunit alpha [Planctomycetota bacterium]|nr:DNA-directed RNA polymerase subunit alpha [Planctomycetota bacterium]
MRIRWRGFELPTHVTLNKETATDKYGMFDAEPFERGYGVTIGNSLRRVLLSSLEGAAVMSLRLEVGHKGDDGKHKTTQISHEFTAIPGLYEDVTDLVLNIKEMRLKLYTDEPVVLKIERKSKGPVKAGDIAKNERFEIVNPELVLCNLTDDIHFDLELTARKGRGYRTAEENIVPDQLVGVIPVDSIYTPVKRVRYKVDNTRVGQQTDYDKLALEIWTDGTITPEMALVEASTILRKHFNPFVKYFELGKQIATEGVGVAAGALVEGGEDNNVRELREKLKQPVSVLEPSVRAENCMAAANIQILADLVKLTEADVLKIKNFGKTSLKEIKKKLGDMGLSFGMEVPEEAGVGVPAGE